MLLELNFPGIKMSVEKKLKKELSFDLFFVFVAVVEMVGISHCLSFCKVSILITTKAWVTFIWWVPFEHHQTTHKNYQQYCTYYQLICQNNVIMMFPSASEA